jgi:DNA-binding transcriptional MocR family regulator
MNLSTITRAFGNCTENGLAKNQKFSVFLQVLVELIDSGMLPEDSNLPPTRTLSQAIGLSRATVAKAYEHLLFLGKVQSRQGSRVWVAPISFRSAETRTATAKTEEPQLSDVPSWPKAPKSARRNPVCTRSSPGFHHWTFFRSTSGAV